MGTRRTTYPVEKLVQLLTSETNRMEGIYPCCLSDQRLPVEVSLKQPPRCRYVPNDIPHLHFANRFHAAASNKVKLCAIPFFSFHQGSI